MTKWSPVRAARGADVAQRHYYAFISYSHKDSELAAWLQREIERYRVPPALAGRLTSNGVIPKRLAPVFRDEPELAASRDLGETINAALAASQFLIVLCSPAAAKSEWTNAEIAAFKRSRPDGCVLAVIASGEPFASDIPGREHEECFPPALRQKFDRRGRPTGRRAEPLAADLRGEAEARQTGFLKLVAGMLGVGLDELVQRETTRRQRRLARLTAASVIGMAIAIALAIAAIQARDAARDQRREAEGLVAFMLGDLKDKLEPIGRLDALDGVGARVLAYYSKQDTSDLPDAALLQRSRALSLTAEVSYMRGQLDEAVRLYREAEAGTAEAIRRDPSDPQRLFDHAQNVFWIGELARQRGDNRAAEQGAREYKQLAQKMVAFAPDNMKWRMEEQYADANLGIVLYEQRRFAEAASQFARALRTIEGLAVAQPDNSQFQKARSEALAWLADARMSDGQLDQAIELRQRQLALLQSMARRTGDVDYRLRMVPAYRALGNLQAARGQMQPALASLESAASTASGLLPTEPDNSLWLEYAANARLNHAELLAAAGQRAAASAAADAGCAISRRLVARDRSATPWRAAHRYCQVVAAEIALSAGDAARALSHASDGLRIAQSLRSNDPATDRYMLSRIYRLIGDARSRLGDEAGARQAYAAGLRALPQGLPERPGEASERLKLLQRGGRSAEAKPLARRLQAMGYRSVA